MMSRKKWAINWCSISSIGAGTANPLTQTPAWHTSTFPSQIWFVGGRWLVSWDTFEWFLCNHSSLGEERHGPGLLLVELFLVRFGHLLLAVDITLFSTHGTLLSAEGSGHPRLVMSHEMIKLKQCYAMAYCKSSLKVPKFGGRWFFSSAIFKSNVATQNRHLWEPQAAL